MLRSIIGLVCLSVCTIALADDTPPPKLSGDIELGLNFVRGNTYKDTLLLKGSADYKKNDWENMVRFKAYSAQDNGIVSAENYQITDSLNYFYKPKQFLFGEVSFSNDRFIGFSRRYTETVGYGQHFYDSDKLKLTGKGSMGLRQTTKTDNDKDNVFIQKVAADATWQINEKWKLSENADIAIGPDARITESDTTLAFKTSEHLFLKLGFNLKHINKVPAGKKNTDSTTALTVAYEI